MPKGGARPGAGRPKGKLSEEARERQRVELHLQRRRFRAADKVFNAQLSIALGSTYVYEIVETGEGKNKKREHVLVTDPERIRQFLDNPESDDGYMYITTDKPDGKAISDIFDRAFGRPLQGVEMTGKDGGPIEVTDPSVDLKKLSAEQLRTLRDLVTTATIAPGDRDGAGEPLPN